MCQRCVKDVSEMCQVCVRDVSNMCQRCLLFIIIGVILDVPTTRIEISCVRNVKFNPLNNSNNYYFIVFLVINRMQ